MKAIPRTVLAIGFALVFGNSASAAIVVSSIPNLSDTSVSVSYTQWEAQSISSDPTGPDFEIVSLVLDIDIVLPNESFILWIVPSDESGFRPDMSSGPLVEFDTMPWKNGEAEAALVPLPSETPPRLQGGAIHDETLTYWIVLGATAVDPDSGNGRIDWNYASTGAGNIGSDGWSVGSSVSSAGAEGTNWTHLSAPNAPYLFELTVAVVPEPAHTTLFMALLALTATLFRRRPWTV